MSIPIPDDLELSLKLMADTRQISVEQLAVESLRTLLQQTGSPRALLDEIRALPRPDRSAVDELESAIRAGRLPVRESTLFDR